MPSVVTFSTWVSPRWKSPDPCALGDLEPLGDDLLRWRGPTASARDPLPRALRRLAFDHEHVHLALVVLAAGHDDVERRELELLIRRVHLPRAADEADTHRPDGPVEGKPRERHRKPRRVDRRDVIRVR